MTKLDQTNETKTWQKINESVRDVDEKENVTLLRPLKDMMTSWVEEGESEVWKCRSEEKLLQS